MIFTQTKLEFSIVQQGGPIVLAAYTHDAGPSVMAAELLMRTKHAACWGDMENPESGPTLILGCDEGAMYCDAANKDKNTQVLFPSLPGWRIWAAESCERAVYICFVKIR